MTLPPRLSACLLLALAASCASPGTTWVAHRGNSSEAPENTLAAVRSALALEPPPAYVEVDVRATADGQLAVLHDETLDRTTDRQGAIAELDWATVRAASAGYAEQFGEDFAEERLPLLEHVLDAVVGSETGVMIEVKPRGLGASVAYLLVQRGETRRHLVASFEPSVLVDASLVDPQIGTVFLTSDPSDEELELARRIGADVIACHHEKIDGGAVQRAHRKGLALWAYTVNGPGRTQELLDLGVDGVISDRVASVRPR